MKQNKAPQIPQDIQEVLEQLECWRQSKPKPRAMPQHLWQDAVSLVPKYGVYKVSHLLKMNYMKLKRLAQEAQIHHQAHDVVIHEAASTEFVSFPNFLFPTPHSPSSPTVLELSSTDGRSLVIRTHQPLDLDALIHSFTRSEGV